MQLKEVATIHSNPHKPQITSIMKTTQETLSSLNINIGDNLSEFLESGHTDLHDWLHESADGHEDVIYYAKAEALYISASLKERQDAEAMVEDCGEFVIGTCQADVAVAYWITYARLDKEVREELAEAIADLEAAQEYGEDDMLEAINEALDCLEAL